jgi:hypothetical protein
MPRGPKGEKRPTDVIETVLIDTSHTREIDRMEDPSQSIARIWVRLSRVVSRALLPLALMATVSTVNAEQQAFVSTVTTAALVESCNKPRQLLAADFCLGYILGVYDQASATRVICPPQSRSGTAQAMAVAIKFLNDNPATWNRHPSVLVEEAFRNTFRC